MKLFSSNKQLREVGFIIGLILLFSDVDPIYDEKFSYICYIFRITQKEKVLIRSLHRALMLSNAARAARHAVSQK